MFKLLLFDNEIAKIELNPNYKILIVLDDEF